MTTEGIMYSKTAGTSQSKQELGSLGAYRYKLRIPLPIKVSQQNDKFIAYVEEPINEYGYGDTASEALDDLRQSIIDLYESLKKHSYCLGKEPKRELRWLEKNLGVKWFDH